MKDKLTGTTHEEREKDRQERDEAERKAYERHIFLRQAMSKAIQTGEPQLVGKDKQGRALYLEPPQGGGGGWGGSGSYHQDPNARYVRPDYGYSRPYGRRAGGGYGYPIVSFSLFSYAASFWLADNLVGYGNGYEPNDDGISHLFPYASSYLLTCIQGMGGMGLGMG